MLPSPETMKTSKQKHNDVHSALIQLGSENKYAQIRLYTHHAYKNTAFPDKLAVS